MSKRLASTELGAGAHHRSHARRRLALLAMIGALVLCGGCQRQAAAPPAKPDQTEQAAKHNELQKAIEAPINKAKALEQPLLDSAHKVDEVMDEQDKATSDGN